jgi:hypothetical protein
MGYNCGLVEEESDLQLVPSGIEPAYPLPSLLFQEIVLNSTLFIKRLRRK